MFKQPVLIEVAARNTTADTVFQVIHPVEQYKKRELLSKLIREGNWKQTLVFTRTKHGANKLVKALLADNISASAIHGNKSQGARTRALAEFKRGQSRVLVATDIAARGLDINLLPHVVNYELPDTPENYIHRIGRTGRAGANGKAISLVCPEENYELHGIHRLLKREIPVEYIEGFDAQLLTTAGQPARKQSSFRGNNKNKTTHFPKNGYAVTAGITSIKPKQTTLDDQSQPPSEPKTTKKISYAKSKKPGQKVWRHFGNKGQNKTTTCTN